MLHIKSRLQLPAKAFGTDKYENNVVYQYGENFCDWIGKQDGVSYYKIAKPDYGGETGQLEDAFKDIADEMIYVVDAGSKVVDVIGADTDSAGNDYDFAFVNNLENLKLTVGGKELAKTDLTEDLGFTNPNETARYGFGESSQEQMGGYPFVLHYYEKGEDGQSDECFVWDINVPVEIDNTVQLTYTVQLTNPQSAVGTYGDYDEDGSKKYDGLYTNNSATLYPKDSNGNTVVPEYFAKPTVSYVISSGGSSGGGGGNTRPDPDDLNTEDHYAYIIGYPGGTIRPQSDITRAEVATIFFRMLTDDARSENWSQTNSYTDVAATDWYNNAISTLSSMGIISGYPDGSFRPNDSITRAEFTKIAVGFFDEAGSYVAGTYPDVPADAWYADFIDAAVDLGLIEGYPDGTIRPDETITRAETCTIVNRTLNRIPDRNHLLPEEEMLVWPDNSDTNAWYYAQMQEATNSHDYEWIGEEDDQIENWTEKLADRDWDELEREWSDANSAPGGEVMD